MKSSKFIIAALLMCCGVAANAKGQAIGTDLIRWLDEGQLVSEAANVFYQHPLSKSTAAVFTWASGDGDTSMLEGAFKSYRGGYMSGTYLQVGGALFNLPNDDEIGLHAAIGYESSPAKGFLFFGTVKATKVLDVDGIGYTPMLGAMFVF